MSPGTPSISTVLRIVLDETNDQDLLRGLRALKRSGRAGAFGTMALRSFFASEKGRNAMSVLLGDVGAQETAPEPPQQQETALGDGQTTTKNISTLDMIFSK